MRVLVTGAGGFIGSEVVGHLARQNHEVLAVDREGALASRVAGWSARVSTAAVDLDDVTSVRALLGEARPEALIHLAWYASPQDYLVSPANLASLAMTTALVEMALSLGCRKIVAAGTCVEYANRDRPLVEDDRADPATLYGSCKHSAWLVCRALAAAADAELSWGRIFHLHGPKEDPRRLIPWVAGELRLGKAVALTDGTQVRDHLHVSDVATGLVALLAKGASGAYNICSGEPVTLRRVLEIVGDIVGRRDLLQFGARPHRAGEIMFLAGDSRRLRALGWAPRFGLEDGLRDALGVGPS
jgi:dTDP-6-deoxy-L-talose 4-dehydrogenase (NAD+)